MVPEAAALRPRSRRRSTPARFLLAIVGCLLVLAGFGPSASAAPVLMLDQAGHARVVDDRALRDNWSLILPAGDAAAHRAPGLRAASGRTVQSELARLYRSRKIDSPSYRGYSAGLSAAERALNRLSGTRKAELAAVLSNLHEIAAAGMLTPSRLPVLFLTLDRNRKWWTTGPLLSPSQRVEFAGSDVVWQYYSGQGIELQQLGSFGKAQWYCSAGSRYSARCRSMVSALIPLAARRAGGLTWEYYFQFDGGRPPWTSAMSQGTALQTLADASREVHDKSYLDVARRALAVFRTAPPAGVRVPTATGARFVQYSFDPAPSDQVLNGFLQSLIGLSDYAQTSGNLLAARLFAAGDAEARVEVPHFDTGAWSLYQPGEEDDLDYHTLVTGFLQQLCAITTAHVYCGTARRFTRDLKTPPVLRLLTASVRAGSYSRVAFQLSKISRVGITISRGRRTVLLTSATFTQGRHTFSVPPLRPAGPYTVKLDATDLAGNYGEVTGTVQATG
jgi:D-glucuronyl C5-epimerase C-terminus